MGGNAEYVIWAGFVLLMRITTVKADDQLRPVRDDAELKQWLQNMVWYYDFTNEEIEQVMRPVRS